MGKNKTYEFFISGMFHLICSDGFDLVQLEPQKTDPQTRRAVRTGGASEPLGVSYLIGVPSSVLIA